MIIKTCWDELFIPAYKEDIERETSKTASPAKGVAVSTSVIEQIFLLPLQYHHDHSHFLL